MSLYPIAEKQTYTAVRLGLFGWRELKADAELRVYNYYKPQSPLFVMAAPMGSHPEFEPGRQRDENGDCGFWKRQPSSSNSILRPRVNQRSIGDSRRYRKQSRDTASAGAVYRLLAITKPSNGI